VTNIEQGLAPGHRNVNCLENEKKENCISAPKSKSKDSFASRPIEPECETKRVSLDPRVLDKAVMISQDLTSNEEAENCSHSWTKIMMFLHGEPPILRG
jgi:hypothetical protein